MISRDSWLLYVGIGIAVVTYLLNVPPPTQWNYQDWLQATSAVFAAVFARLQTSPLVGQQAADVGAKAAEVVEAKRSLEAARNQNEPG